ncbi:protein-L-isoaspartate O-methyltransferase family protein [Amphibiibacter pelophylacis]|uniref:Methyltransferase domain-containing protein n=1 Tax=Amphibiibacter pelophylacis TaxID=1799477 RepID=A0ACC6P0H5_9BURK
MSTPMTPEAREQARYHMIEQQIRPWNVLDEAVLATLSRVHREDFVPPAQRELALMDCELPLDDGQIMLSPKVQARLVHDTVTALVPTARRILLIGAGTGYMVALLADLGCEVLATEQSPALLKQAEKNLRGSRVRLQAGSAIPSEGNGFDAVLLAGSLPSIPDALWATLHPNGLIVGIVGRVADPLMVASRLRRVDGRVRSEPLFETWAPALLGLVAEPREFVF